MKLALGTAQFGLAYGVANELGRVGIEEAGQILAESASRGVDMLDTAIAYGDSERMLGEIGVKNWRIVTKLPAVPDDCTDVTRWVDAEVKGSLVRLGVERLYAVLLHRPDQLHDGHGKQLHDALQGLKAQGVTEKIGVTIYSPEELECLFDCMDFDLVQAPVSIVDRRLVDSGWARRLQRRGVELHARSVFLQGLLLLLPARRPKKFQRWHVVWAEWDRWLQESGLTPLEACLRYTLSIDEVDKVVVGVDCIEHLRGILAVAKGLLPSLPEWTGPVDVDLLNPVRWDSL